MLAQPPHSCLSVGAEILRAASPVFHENYGARPEEGARTICGENQVRLQNTDFKQS